MSKLLKTNPQVIMKNGKPSAVIIDIRDYQEMLAIGRRDSAHLIL